MRQKAVVFQGRLLAAKLLGLCIGARRRSCLDLHGHQLNLLAIHAPVFFGDNGPIHTSKMSRAALAARAHWLAVEWMPKYAPELNDIERIWHDLKAHHLAHQTFVDTDDLDRAIHHAVGQLNAERRAIPLAEPRISA